MDAIALIEAAQLKKDRAGFVPGDQLLVRDREVLRRAAVVHLDPELHVGGTVSHLGDAVAQRTVEQQRLGVGIVEAELIARRASKGTAPCLRGGL